MKCPKCGKNHEDYPANRIPFRAVCDRCLAYLHSCKNCKFYQPGLPNDCRVPETDPIADREASNLCEEFSLLLSPPKTSSDNDAAKKKFNSLFGDP